MARWNYQATEREPTGGKFVQIFLKRSSRREVDYMISAKGSRVVLGVSQHLQMFEVKYTHQVFHPPNTKLFVYRRTHLVQSTQSSYTDILSEDLVILQICSTL